MSKEKIEYTESDIWIFQNVLCGACRKSLKASKYLNGVTLDRKARWEFPIWGNILIPGCEGRAVAYVCDLCIDTAREKDLPIPVNFAVEIGDNSSWAKYHLISGLVKVPPVQSCPRCGAIGYFERNICDQCNHTWDPIKDHR